MRAKLKFSAALIPVFLLVACSGLLPGGTAVIFIIPQGAHYSSGVFFEYLETDRMDFSFLFDESAVYSLGENNPNQADINKLFGFAEGSPLNIHNYSARFGWRWYNDELQILAYAYTAGERKSLLMGTAEPGEWFYGSIESTDEAYVFSFSGEEYIIRKEQPFSHVCKYLSYPYFGGDEAAPHQISISVKLE